MQIPEAPYVGLYGSHSGDWREGVIAALTSVGVAHYDPTDPGWGGINEANGDARQAELDALVATTHRGMNGAACVIFHIARLKARGGVPTGETTMALASRCELGYLTGRGTRTFVHIDADVEGRNYLWAQIAPYPHMTRCVTLDEATAHAIAVMKG
jgi:hypothetical protein